MSRHVVDFAIELSHVIKSFKVTKVIRDLSLNVSLGSRLAFVGPNGAGKSTTIKLLMGLLRADSGELRIHGLDPISDRREVRQLIGYVPEQHHFYRWMTVKEVLAFAGSMYHNWDSELSRSLTEIFAMDPSKRVRDLSKGMLGRLALVVAVSHRPQVLILDEPLSGLDPIARGEFVDCVMRNANERGQTVFFSSHELHEVSHFATDIAFMVSGRVSMHRRVDDLLANVRRVKMILSDCNSLRRCPEGTIYERVNGCEWNITVDRFSSNVVSQLQVENRLTLVAVSELSLNDLFNDVVKGTCSDVL